MELEGTVKFRSDRGVWVDIGYEKNARINATRQLAFRLKRNQRVATTVQAVDPRRGEVWVSAADLPTLRPWEALQVGMTTEGRVAFRSSAGVFVDIGFEQNGIVLAANRSQMFEALKQDQIVAATVEGVDGSTIRVSVAGVPKPRSLQELRVGETLEGAVGSKTERGVFVDVGCEKPALVIAPREEAYALGRSQPVTATVERVQGDVFWVSVAGLPKLPFPEELQVGSIVNGTVARKSTEGVLLDIGNAEMARVLAPRAMVLERLRYRQQVSAKVEKTCHDGVLVSLEGLPRLKLLEQLEVGGAVDGEYVQTRKGAALFDIGCESLASLTGPRDEVLKLRKFERLEGMRIDKVDIESRKISVSFAGLSDLVANRTLIRRSEGTSARRTARF